MYFGVFLGGMVLVYFIPVFIILVERNPINFMPFVFNRKGFPVKAVITPALIDTELFKITPALNGVRGNDDDDCLAFHTASIL